MLGSSSPWRLSSILITPLRRYLFAFGTVVLSVLFAAVLSIQGHHASYLMFFPAVLFTLWYARIGPTLFAIILSAIAVVHILVPPYFNITMDDWRDNALRTCMFVLTTGLSAWVFDRKRASDESRIAVQGELLESAQEAISITDSRGRIVFWNGGAEKFFGWSKAKALGKDVQTLLPAIYPKILEHAARQLQSEGSWQGRLHYRSLSGEEIISDAFWTLHRQTGATMRTSMDVTERVRAVQALRLSEATNRTTFELAAVGIAHVALDGSWLRVNDKLCNIVGYTREELMGMTFQEITHPDDLSGNLALVQKVLADEIKSYSLDKRYIRKDRTIVWIHLTVSLVRSASGEPVHFISVVEDISAHKAAELKVQLLNQDLAESEKRYRSIFNDALIGLYRTTPDGRVLMVNPALARMLGSDSADDVLKWTLDSEHFAPEYSREDFKREVEERGSILGREAMWKRRDGTELYVRESAQAVRNDAGEIVCYEGTVEDITARRKDEQKIVELEAKFMQSQKMEAVGRLAGGIAHDFNNLLTVIMGQTEILTLELEDLGLAAQRAESVMKSAKRAAELTAQLLAFSRKQTIQPKVTSMNRLVTGISDMMHRLVGEDVAVQLVLQDEVWPVQVDRTQFEQVIMNLLVNARDAMPDGGRLTLETSNAEVRDEYTATRPVVPPGKYVMLAVTDTGTGMSAETQERVFEPFFTTKEMGKGTGLGLAVVYGIVKQSGGFIWVYSELGKGTCFKIYLPKAELREAAKIEESALPIQPIKKKATILLVEDEDSLRELISEFLKSGGHEVIEAGNLDEACRAALERKLAIDLLLTDVVLKGGNAKQLVYRLEEQGCSFRTLYMSGYTPNAIVHHGVLDPGILFLQKPFSRSTLLSKVEEALSLEACRQRGASM